MKRYLLIVSILLAGCGGKSTADWLAQLQAPDSAARLHAINALGNRTSEVSRVVPALASALQDPDAFVRRDAAEALGRFGPEAREALPALLPLLRDRHPGVRKAATRAVKKIDAEVAIRSGVR
jgi:HEAT repeat protein